MVWREKHAKTRKFGDLVYSIEASHRSKQEAKNRAKALRKKGKLVRIVKWETSNLPHQYVLYSRYKKRD